MVVTNERAMRPRAKPELILEWVLFASRWILAPCRIRKLRLEDPCRRWRGPPRLDGNGRLLRIEDQADCLDRRHQCDSAIARVPAAGRCGGAVPVDSERMHWLVVII
jgi:hypothetical protein